ncbi:hypothetical protein HZ326_13605 [Fusarium oxysporum f. sp. albedinis]|nr:hypothetical protein HZ326_13605 [Fusarium oxysporum f. sp. albedinis]
MMVMLGLGGSQKAGTAQTNNVRSAVGKIRKVWPWPGVSGSGSGFCVGGKAGPEGPAVSVYGWVGSNETERGTKISQAPDATQHHNEMTEPANPFLGLILTEFSRTFLSSHWNLPKGVSKNASSVTLLTM